MKLHIYMMSAFIKTIVTPSFVVGTIVLVSIVLSAGLLFDQHSGMRARIGITLQHDPLSERFYHNLLRYGADHIEIVLYDNPSQMAQDTASQKIACGYELPLYLENRHANPDIHAYRSPLSLTDGLTDFLVAVAYIETLSGHIGAEVLAPYINIAEQEHDMSYHAASIEAIARSYLAEGVLMEYESFEHGAINGDNHSHRNAPYTRVFHGLVGLFGLLISMLLAAGIHKENSNDISLRFTAAGFRRSYAVYSKVLGSFAIIMVYLAITLFAGKILYPSILDVSLVGLAAPISYGFALAALTVCFAQVHDKALHGLTLLIFVFATLLGGTFFEIREILASIWFVRYSFINAHYLDAALGSWSAIGIMGAFGIFTVIILALTSDIPIKHSA